MGREVRRVARDFSWPLNTVWQGFINPHHVAVNCFKCKGSGYSRRAKRIHDEWYGYVPFDLASTGSMPFPVDHPKIVQIAERNCGPGASARFLNHECERLQSHFNGQWMHHLSQADVDALIAAERLVDFTHRFIFGKGWKPIEPKPVVTAKEVNDWSLHGFGHDSINSMICIRERCKREGIAETCNACKGHGEIWPSKEAKKRCDEWQPTPPPAGEGWQMWETTSEGSPISPVCESAEALARWLVENKASAGGRDTATYEQWLEMIKAGSAVSFVAQEGTGLVSGVAAISMLKPNHD